MSDLNDINQQQIATATAYVYKDAGNGIEYDEQGHITNELVRTQTFTDLPVEKVEEE